MLTQLVGHFWLDPNLSPFFGYAKQFFEGTGFCFVFLCKGRVIYYISRHFCFCFGGALQTRIGAVGDDAPNG
jgi:hypothetical protein